MNSRYSLKVSIVTIITFCFFSATCYCQEDSICSYTINKNEGNGLSLRVFTPCNWQNFQGRPGVVKAFKDSNGTSLVIMINKAKENSNGYYITEQKIANDYKQFAEVVSTRTTKLEGLPSIEAIIEYSDERPVGVVYLRSLIYSTVYKNYLFTLTYSCTGLDKEDTHDRFEENLYTFKILASRTILLNKTTFQSVER